MTSANPRALRRLRRREGDGEIVQRCRKALAITSPELGALLAADRRTVTRWESNSSRVPGSTWLALYLLLWSGGQVALAGTLPIPIAARDRLALSNRIM
jgi:DNA-binding transcriptional regulator YiaG